jgi:hypothetical protein
MNDIDPRAPIFAAIERARAAVGIMTDFTELEQAVINDLLDRVRVPRPMEPSGGPLVPGVEF